MYISDFKVHPAWRGGGAADTLTLWARDQCVAAHGPGVLAFLTVLAGNKAMMRRMEGPRGLPVITRVATFRSHTVPLVWGPAAPGFAGDRHPGRRRRSRGDA